MVLETKMSSTYVILNLMNDRTNKSQSHYSKIRLNIKVTKSFDTRLKNSIIPVKYTKDKKTGRFLSILSTF